IPSSWRRYWNSLVLAGGRGAGCGRRIVDGAARADDLRGVAALDVRQAVARRVTEHDQRARDALVDRLERAERHTGVGLVVRVVRLGVRNRRADVRSGGGLLGAILEPEVRRDGDREQDADDDQDDEQLDQGEATLI